MKEIRTIKMVEQTEVKFVADDGKEFVGANAENDCATYERQKNTNKVKEAFERLDAVNLKIPMINWYCDEAEVWRIVLESKKDYLAMTDYFKVVDNCYDNYTEMPKEFPYTMTVLVGYDYFSEYSGNIKEELEKALEQFN